MGTNAKSSKGIKLQRGDGGGPENFTTIAEVTDFQGPGENAPQLDATSFDSIAQEFIAGLADNGEISFSLQFIGSDPQQQGLRSDLRAGTTRNFKLNFNDHNSDPSIISFAAIVTMAPEPKAGVNKVVTGSAKLKLTGQASYHYRPN